MGLFNRKQQQERQREDDSPRDARIEDIDREEVVVDSREESERPTEPMSTHRETVSVEDDESRPPEPVVRVPEPAADPIAAELRELDMNALVALPDCSTFTSGTSCGASATRSRRTASARPCWLPFTAVVRFDGFVVRSSDCA